MREFLKDPDAVLDYVFDWASWLATSETISTSTFYVDGVVFGTLPWTISLVMDSKSATSTTTKVWLSAGTEGERYRITNRITTNQGRTEDRSAVVRVGNR